MKKNVDQMTADLYNATKAAYLREFSGIIRNNGKCQPVTVDIMAQLANGHGVDGLALADGTDLKKSVDLMPGYSCGLASLPRIYKQVARLAGETCEKITVGGAVLNAYGLTDEQLKAKENKKILAVLKKYCPAPKKNDSRQPWPYKMGLYHDSLRRCAVWTDARILIVAPWLYNDAAADQIVAADGTKITDFEGQPAKYPNWARVVPDMSYKTAKAKKIEVYSMNAAAVAANAASVAAMVKGVKKAKEYFVAARYASDGGIIAFAHTFAPWLSLVDGDIYFKNAHTAAVGYIRTAAGNGFILFMPMMVEDDEINQYADNKTIYADTENDIYIKNQLPQAAADSLPLPFLAVCPEVSTPAEPVADAAADVVEAPAEPVADAAADVVEASAEPVADAAADVVEAPAAPLPGWCKDNTTVFNTLYNCKGIIKDFTYNKLFESWQCTFINIATGTEYKKHSISYMEPIEEAPAATLTDADVLAQAARIKAIYEDIQAEADSQPAGMSCDDLADNTPIYTAADVEKMIEAATADTYTADEVADMVAAAVAEERAKHTRRRFAPRLRPVLRRLGRVAAVVLPLLIVALFMGASTAGTPAADAAAVTTCQAAEKVAQVVELPAVTVTAAAVTDTPAAPSPVKKLAAHSPVKKAAADAVTLPNQKTASDLATASAPAADDADSLTTAPAADGLQPTPPDGLTICAGTAWAYTMMNWA